MTSVTARPRTSADCTRLKTPPTLSKATSTWPPSTPVSCCAPPSKWTMRNSAPVASCTIRMARWSSLRMPVVQALILPGVLLRRVGELGQRLVGTVALDPDQAGIEYLVHDGNEAVDRERRLALGIERDGVHAGQVEEAQRVAVRLGAGDIGEADLAAGAGLVDHGDGLAEVLFGHAGQDAGADIGAAAGREGDDQLHGAARVVLRQGRAGNGGGRRGGEQGTTTDEHAIPPFN